MWVKYVDTTVNRFTTSFGTRPTTVGKTLELSAAVAQTTYAKAEDWIFASVRKKGASPRVGNMLVRDYLYPAAVQAGVLTKSRMQTTWIDRKTGKTVEGEKTVYFDRKGERVKRFGFHQFRHSLSSFLTTKKKVDPKTAQTALRQSNAAFTLDKYRSEERRV